MIDAARQNQLARAEQPQPPAIIQTSPAIRHGGAGSDSDIHLAYCKDAAGTGLTIVCYLDVDFTSASAWSSETTYALNVFATYGGYTWRSLKAGNTGNIPAEGIWWTNAEITVYCELYEGGTNLNECAPLLADGDPMKVVKIGDYWRSLTTFIPTDTCE